MASDWGARGRKARENTLSRTSPLGSPGQRKLSEPAVLTRVRRPEGSPAGDGGAGSEPPPPSLAFNATLARTDVPRPGGLPRPRPAVPLAKTWQRGGTGTRVPKRTGALPGHWPDLTSQSRPPGQHGLRREAATFRTDAFLIQFIPKRGRRHPQGWSEAERKVRLTGHRAHPPTLL